MLSFKKAAYSVAVLTTVSTAYSGFRLFNSKMYGNVYSEDDYDDDDWNIIPVEYDTNPKNVRPIPIQIFAEHEYDVEAEDSEGDLATARKKNNKSLKRAKSSAKKENKSFSVYWPRRWFLF